MPNFPYGRTVTITPQTADPMGDRSAGDPVDVDGCVVYETPGIETVGGQDTGVVTATVLAPAGTEIASTDRVTIDGDGYEVASQPIDWQSPFTGLQPGVQFTVRRVTG